MNDDNNNDVIESSVEDVMENTEELLEEAPQEPKAKSSKGGFLGFLALLVSLGALALSSYLFLNNNDSQLPADQWKQPLQSLKTQLQKSSNDFDTQVQNLKKGQSALRKDLQDLQTSLDNKADETGSLSAETTQSLHDPQFFERQVDELSSKIEQQNLQIQSLSSQLKQSQQQQTQSLQELKTQVQDSSNVPVQRVVEEVNFQALRAKEHIRMAAMHLEVHGNKDLALTALEKAKTELQQGTGQHYDNLLFEMNQTIRLIEEVSTLDLDATLKQMNDALAMIQNLGQQSSSESTSESSEDSSWYENLIVIRKVDDSGEAKLSATERLILNNQIQVHFDLLRLALYARDADQWNKNLEQVESLLENNYPQSADSALKSLQDLKAVEFVAQFPSLQGLIGSLESLQERQ